MYCIHCGKEIADDSNFDENDRIACEVAEDCAVLMKNDGILPIEKTEKIFVYRSSVDDDNIGWGVLGFFFPIVGLILFLVWNKDYPKRARMCGKGALIGVIVSVAASVLYVILILGLASCLAAGGYYY